MEGFRETEIDTGDTTIFATVGGAGPALLLLHGFPETHLMWRTIAPALAQRFTVVCADLRGYGRSGCPPSSDDHSPYTKRTMARDMVQLMSELGHERFAVAGHDRGGRVGYRLALDYAECVTRFAALDVIPTEDAWARADHRLALAFWPWSLLAQPSPLPEALLTVGAEAIVDNALKEWGSASTAFPPEVRDAYVAALKAPEHAQAICEEYRAAVSLDREHDRADLAIGRRIACPVLALWSGLGGLESWYAGEGGPLAIWRRWADHVTGHAIAGGHFFPEEHPQVTAKALAGFFQT